jgi:DNA-binding PadR family transcriptional regulator
MTVLRIIKANDGRFSWYQIDRELTHREGFDPGIVSSGLMPVLRELEHSGCIIAAAGQNSTPSLFSITPAGRQQLEA